ncbi:C2 domain containing protein [Acanthamoeba castellanii str. Neff]|uniref:C2 domain containing protein n=1 Tax=Acanthamoeba castellanii (strain ATCC 30010 / Neff) TaxID=1257118 RepID=L8GIM5_ACACF|nr:C2 domain containing protein [Acanthamoeba castellanii str. Neff]ELR12852.1 C2 domain containing protein [Acanthamoeba castellanii str. Neff]
MRKGTVGRSPQPQPKRRGQADSGEDDDGHRKPSWMIPGSPDYLAIKVLVVEGRCAQRVDKKGKIIGDPDVYVRLSYYGNKWETQLMRNNTAPKWNEAFEIPIPPDRRNALGELEIKVWDMLDKKKEIFMGEPRGGLTHWPRGYATGDYGGVNYEYVEPRRYKLKGGATSKDARGDVVIGRLTLRVGMVLPKKKKYQWDESKGERTTESL